MNVIVECHGNEKKEGFTKKEVGGKVRARQDKEVLLVLNRRWLTCKAFDSCKDEVSRRILAENPVSRHDIGRPSNKGHKIGGHTCSDQVRGIQRAKLKELRTECLWRLDASRMLKLHRISHTKQEHVRGGVKIVLSKPELLLSVC
uniref:Uncharacterized protein n=1 Tax=Cucumis melo TaxID=3656 RepID=A0A9I9E936_CUCME